MYIYYNLNYTLSYTLNCKFNYYLLIIVLSILKSFSKGMHSTILENFRKFLENKNLTKSLDIV